jgi:hypothetical protein
MSRRIMNGFKNCLRNLRISGVSLGGVSSFLPNLTSNSFAFSFERPFVFHGSATSRFDSPCSAQKSLHAI